MDGRTDKADVHATKKRLMTKDKSRRAIRTTKTDNHEEKIRQMQRLNYDENNKDIQWKWSKETWKKEENTLVRCHHLPPSIAMATAKIDNDRNM